MMPLIRSHDGPICFVKFPPSRIYKSLLTAAKGKCVFHCLKEMDDVVVGATFAEKLGKHKHYIVCGINTPYCVLSTALGILKRRKNSTVTLVESCCGSQFGKTETSKFLSAKTPNVENVYGNRRKKFDFC